jgi:hypothetical protein
MDERDPAQDLAHDLMESIHSSWIAQAAYVAAELGVADLLAGGPRSSDELAGLAGAHGPSLHRLLRALVTLDLVRQLDDGRFELRPRGSALRTDQPGSLRHWIIWWGGQLWPVWGNLLYSVKTGKSARAMLAGTEGFDHLAHDPRAAAVFNKGLAELTSLTARSVVAAYDFSTLRHVVDVGGGYGQLLAAILHAHPGVRGTLFELPHAIDGARAFLTRAGVIGRCELVAGDFFQSVPAGADAYLLKSVIHDWNDERAGAILHNCRRAMTRAGARLLLAERVVPARFEPSPQHRALARTDLSMLVTHAAAERSEAGFRALLDATGYDVTRIVPGDHAFSVIEAVPRPGGPGAGG